MTNVLSDQYAGIPLLTRILAVALPFLGNPAWAADDGSVLPFPPTPSASVAGATLRNRGTRPPEPSHRRRSAQHPGHPAGRCRLRPARHLRRRDPYADPDPRRAEGISYNTFHTTAICSPTRAALLTGRNHQRVGSGTIAERAVDWDGYTA